MSFPSVLNGFHTPLGLIIFFDTLLDRQIGNEKREEKKKLLFIKYIKKKLRFIP